MVAGVKLLGRLPSFLRNGVGLEQAQAIVTRRLDQRQADFLALSRRVIYGPVAGPYRRLLQMVGCDLGDLERLVGAEGVSSRRVQRRASPGHHGHNSEILAALKAESDVLKVEALAQRSYNVQQAIFGHCGSAGNTIEDFIAALAQESRREVPSRRSHTPLIPVGFCPEGAGRSGEDGIASPLSPYCLTWSPILDRPTSRA